MFIFFTENRANYRKGQVFPFVIAAIVVIIIMAMITANLGKLAIFKTDVSNASDAGSLGAASTLSGFLLQLGLESDTWCANGLVLIFRMAMIFIKGTDYHVPGLSLSNLLGDAYTSGDDVDTSSDLHKFPNDLSAVIKLYVPYMIGFYFALDKANKNGQITWSTAKQKALSSAFGNAGVDEGIDPNKKFKNYAGTYDDYMNKYLSKEVNQSGFSRFMEHPVSGYGKDLMQGGGGIEPDKLSKSTVTSGYGWSQIINPGAADDESFKSSFLRGTPYSLEDNYVEVIVKGSSKYPIEALTWSQFLMMPAITAILVYWGAYTKYVRAGQCTGWWGKIICLVYAGIVTAFYTNVMITLPIGYTFSGRDMKKYTDDNPIKMQVKRHKKDTDMSIWNFQYGNVVSKSAGHAYVVDGSTIEPTLMNKGQFPIGDPSTWFKTGLHLFETGLVDGSVE